MKSNLSTRSTTPHRSWKTIKGRARCSLGGAIFSALLVLGGCEAKVGDPCVSSAQCGIGQLCDINSKEGYCTQRDCEEGSCPSGSICVTFENLDRYCMATCESEGGCRDGYRCDEELADEPICRQAP